MITPSVGKSLLSSIVENKRPQVNFLNTWLVDYKEKNSLNAKETEFFNTLKQICSGEYIENSSESFFANVYFPLFYDHEKYMQWVINSPFVQNIKKQIVNGVKGKLKMPDEESRKVRMNQLKDKIKVKAKNGSLDGSVAIGFPASKLTDNASGQVSNLHIPFTSDDVFLSWIGSGLGLGLKGKYVIFINDPRILYSIFEGWAVYRYEYLNHETYSKNLVPNQIDDWNTQWLYHILDEDLNQEFPLFGLNPIEKSDKSSNMFVKNQSWFTLFYRIANFHPNTTLNSYVCSMGKTNKTIGFIPIELSAFRSLKRIYKMVLGLNFSNAPNFLSIYKVENDDSFIKACEAGKIGINSLIPKDLRPFFITKDGKLKTLNLSKPENLNKLFIFKTWLLAMLNKEDMLQFSNEVAEKLSEYSDKEKDGRSKRDGEIKNFFASSSKNELLKNIIVIEEKASPSVQANLKKLRDEIHFLSNAQDWQYLILLIRFDFILQQSQKTQK